MMKLGLFFICSWVVCCFVNAQSQIGLVAHREKDAIRLRWAPENYNNLLNGFNDGYIIEKYEITFKDSIPSISPMLHQNLVTGAPEKIWEKLCNSRDPSKERYASIAAQAIFGDQFQTQNTISNDITSVYNLSVEQESKYAYSLFCADQCWEVAVAMGLAFEDDNIDSLKNYFYRVYISDNSNNDTAFVYVNQRDKYDLPTPVRFQVYFNAEGAEIKWKYDVHQSFYTSYTLEKSVDNAPFQEVNSTPYVPIANNYNNSYATIYDTASHSNLKVSYRLKGHTPFGIDGPWSNVITGRANNSLSSSPTIEKLTLSGDSVNLQWIFSNEEKVSGFHIYRSTSINGNYILLCDSLLEHSRNWIDVVPESSNYYKVGARKGSKITMSSPRFIQLHDSMPPAPPTDLNATIDTTGKTLLQWNKNTEEDLLGYRIFRSNFKTHEFSQISGPVLKDTIFEDQLNIRKLTDTIYYKIKATDFRYNNSDFSNVLAVAIPDMVPPVPPVFTSVVNTKNEIHLNWIASTSKDVRIQHLYRKPINDTLWTFQRSFKNEVSSYMDTSASDEIYQYTIIAIDLSGNESSPAQPVICQKLYNDELKFSNFRLLADRKSGKVTLTWENGAFTVNKILVYKSINDEPLVMYKTLSGASDKFIDSRVKIGNTYRYLLKQADSRSLSEIKIIKY